MKSQLRHRACSFALAAAVSLTFAVRSACAQSFIHDDIVTGQYGFSIDLKTTDALHNNAAALAAFQRGALEWANQFTNQTTVVINADVSNLGSSTIIGSTSSVQYTGDYSELIKPTLQSHVTDSLAVQSLPSSLVANVPSGFTFDGSRVIINGANAKVLGLLSTTAADATIQFNSGFSFDYDSSNGQTAGTEDFQTVAAHEIGHALGFVSAVDVPDSASSGTIQASMLDLYRFNASSIPTTAAAFSSSARDLIPGDADVTSDIFHAYGMSTGSNKGDGNQASHWKADEQTGSFIGIMDPTLAYGQTEKVSYPDLLAMHLIGYSVVMPEPGSFTLLGFGAAPFAMILRRRRRSGGEAV